MLQGIDFTQFFKKGFIPSLTAVFLSSLCLFTLSFQEIQAQELNPIKWTAETIQKEDARFVVLYADIDNGWYLYSQHLDEGGPIPTSFNIAFNDGEYELTVLEEKSEHAISSFDQMFQMNLKKFKNQARFKVSLPEEFTTGTVRAQIEFMCCDDAQCLAPKIEELTINIK